MENPNLTALLSTFAANIGAIVAGISLVISIIALWLNLDDRKRKLLIVDVIERHFDASRNDLNASIKVYNPGKREVYIVRAGAVVSTANGKRNIQARSLEDKVIVPGGAFEITPHFDADPAKIERVWIESPDALGRKHQHKSREWPFKKA